MNEKINQYTSDGIFIRTWNNLKEASNKIGCSPESIQRCCLGKDETTENFIWKYENDLSQYKLWYISEYNKAWFTNMYEKQWADDADDTPYEHNVGDPYDKWSELIEDNDDITKRKWRDHPIKLKTLYFETNDWSEHKPCTNYVNSPYSVETINKGAIAWLWTNKFVIQTGTTMEDFIKIIKDNNGKIYKEEE